MLAISAGTLAAATLIMFGPVLPAEFNRDPLGLGRLSDLNRLWARLKSRSTRRKAKPSWPGNIHKVSAPT
jgi:hypothetical protein